MGNEKELTQIDLFSGIGGFTLAGEWAGFRTVAFCEKEEFCQKVLRKYWPEVPIIEEIRNFDGTGCRGATLLTGGFPCQPFSDAGQRRGKEDDRYLWPEMRRVIGEAKPRWILAENVSGIFRMELDTVLSDLESEGYTTGTFIIPACGLNAPHRRNRVWIIANSRCQHGKRTENKGEFKRSILEEKNAPLLERPIKNDKPRNASDSSGGRQLECLSERERKKNSCKSNKYTSDSSEKLWGGKQKPKQSKGDPSRKATGDINSNASDSDRQRLQRYGQSRECTRKCFIRPDSWQEDWYEAATRFCRVDDGISDRVHRLKALGNAIVPQIAYEILKNIAWIERDLHG